MSTVSLMTSLLTENCSRFLPPQHNARSPTVWRRACGTARSADDAERKRCRPGRSATWRRLSLRYVKARPVRHRNTSTASLKDIRCGARSQCSRWSRGQVTDYRPAAGLAHINELKFSLYGGAADYQPSRLAEQSFNAMQLQQQPLVKLLLLA